MARHQFANEPSFSQDALEVTRCSHSPGYSSNSHFSLQFYNSPFLSFLLSTLLHLSFINFLSLSFFLCFPHLWEEATFTNFHDQSPFSFSDRNSPGLSLCSHLSSTHCLFSSHFLLLFRFSLFCQFCHLHPSSFSNHFHFLPQVLFLVPLCLSSPVGELSSLLSLSHRPNPALPPALLASTGGYQLPTI